MESLVWFHLIFQSSSNFKNWSKYSARNFNFSLINIQNLKNASKLCETDNVARGGSRNKGNNYFISLSGYQLKHWSSFPKIIIFLESQVKSP